MIQTKENKFDDDEIHAELDNIYKIEKDFNQQLMYIMILAFVVITFYISYFLIIPYETQGFYYYLFAILIFTIIIALFILSIFYFKGKKVEIIFDKDLRTITIINPSKNNKILKKIDFSFVKSVVYYRDFVSSFASYHLVIKLKLHRNIKIFDLSKGDCQIHSITISKITKNPIKFKSISIAHISYIAMITGFLVMAILSASLLGLTFCISVLIISLLFINVKEKKEENEFLDIHNRLLEIGRNKIS